MKKIILALVAVAATLVSCQKEQETTTTLEASFEISANPCYAGDEIHFTSTTTGGVKPYTCVWNINGVSKTGEKIKYTFAKNGTFNVELNVTDDKGSTAKKKKIVVVNPAQVQEKGSLNPKWVAKMEGYNNISTAAVDNDGNVYATTKANKLYKFSSTGAEVWTKTIFTMTNTAGTQGSPSIDTDGTVFIGGGTSDGQATFKAYNPDGSEKWSYSQWWAAEGLTLSPNYSACVAAIDTANIYFGNVGTSGTIQSVNKQTGSRNGFAQPSGGVRAGAVLSNDGYVSWYGGKYGIFGIAQTTLDNGGASKQSQNWVLYNTGDKLATTNMMGGLAIVKIGAQTCVAGIATDNLGTKVYAVEMSTGNLVCEHYIDGAAKQEQGGVVVTADGYLVASLAFTTGQDNGGIIVIDPSTATGVKKWSYNVQEKVSGSCAVDAAGNIHFGTESGHYYVCDKNGTMIVKKSIADAVKAKDPSNFADLSTAKIWSSIAIGDDGTCYLCFTDENTRAFGGVIAMDIKNENGNSICTGPANSDWPMFGQNRRHTNHQK